MLSFALSFSIRNFVEEKLGAKYVGRIRVDLVKAFEDSSPDTPIFFILSPGVDALKDLEILGEATGALPSRPPYRPARAQPASWFTASYFHSLSFLLSFSFVGDGVYGTRKANNTVA